MSRIKKYITIAVCFILCFAIAAAALTQDDSKTADKSFELPDTSHLEISSKRHTQYTEYTASAQNRFGTEGYTEMLKNDIISVWFNEQRGNLRVVDKRNGYVWGSLPDGKVEGLNTSWRETADSICSFEYYDGFLSKRRMSTSSEDVKLTCDWQESSVSCSVWSQKLGMGFDFEILLSDDSLTFKMNHQSIVEEGENKLSSVSFMPFFGSTHSNELEGYMFVPDGPGALIRYTESSSYVAGFEGKVYGLDMGTDILSVASDLDANRKNDYLADEPQVTFPVFGVSHGESNAYLGYIANDEEYATVSATPAGMSTDYNWICCRYDFRNYYLYATGAAGEGVYELEEDVNPVDPEVRYYFLCGDNADYSGMAVKYREVLKEDDVLSEERADTQIPLRLETVGAEVRKGALFDSVEVLTSLKQLEAMKASLNKGGINNITLVLSGWASGGRSTADYNELSLNSKLGSISKLEQLKNASEKNGRFYLSSEVVTANESQIEPKNDAVIAITSVLAKISRKDPNVMFPDSYFLKPQLITERIRELKTEFKGFSLSFGQLGSRLYSEYTRENELRRDQVKKGIFAAVKDIKNGVALSQVNSYLWSETDEYFDIPVVCGQYMYETDTVPFLQIVLKGSVDYYAPYANQGFSSQNSILKMIEFGCYPSFLVMHAENDRIISTPLEDYFSLNFKDWESSIEEIYAELNKALAQVEGAYIIAHEMIAEGVARVSYDNGVKIYVNYNSDEALVDGVTVSAYSWKAIK